MAVLALAPLSEEDQRALRNCANMLEDQAFEWRDGCAEISDSVQEACEDNALDCEFVERVLFAIADFGGEIPIDRHREQSG